ncbi:MAG TPA: ATP-binding protein [Chthoniobacterales bacterium]|nr:ATP-binding protein [Chthoniobacterales bacterium]
MSNNKKPTVERFEVDSALLSEIGEKLVTKPHVALAELVKNSYDADAKSVHVTIDYDEEGRPKVAVRDDGHGMTRDAVHRYWMRIGTTNKEDDQFSPRFGRRRTGAKGIGRFACRRLGRRLDMETTALLEKADRPPTGAKYEKTELLFDWNDFVPGTTVSSVKVEAKSEYLSKASLGLRLSMSMARDDEWSYRGYAYLKRQLAALCANQGAKRDGYAEDPGFKVFLKAPGFQEDETIDLREQLMNAGWGTLSAYIDREGHAVCSLTAKGLGKRQIRSSKPFDGLTDVTLRLAIFPHERELLRDISVVSKGSVSELCNEWGGVQVRFRGFRIYPFGDAEDDWLDIESDRAIRLGKPKEEDIFDFARLLDGVEASRSLLNLLSMKSFLGSVEIGSDQKGLEPKADRMGFVEGNLLRELKRFARFAIDWAMVLRDYSVQLAVSRERDAIRERIEVEHGKKLAPGDSPTETVRAMRGAIDEIAERAPKASQPQLALLGDLTTYLESTLTLASRDLLRLRLVASTATLTLLFAHEVKSLTSTFASISKEIRDLLPTMPANRRERMKTLGEEVRESQRSLGELLELTNSMGVLDRDARPIDIDLRRAAKRAIKRFARITDRYTISIEAKEIPEGLLVGPMLEGELLAILLNVLSNSIKAVIAGGGQRLISLSARRVGKHAQLDVRDTGHGIPADYFEEVFTPMISDPAGTLYDQLEARLNPEDTLLLGGGTGLGLSIVRGVLQARQGWAELLPPTVGWKFHLRIHLP